MAYTPDGTKLVTIGSNDTTRVYQTGSDGEPKNIDGCQEENLALDATVSSSLCHGCLLSANHCRITSSSPVPRTAP